MSLQAMSAKWDGEIQDSSVASVGGRSARGLKSVIEQPIVNRRTVLAIKVGSLLTGM